MIIFNILGFGLSVVYRKVTVHPYFTRDKLGDAFTKHLTVEFCGLRYNKTWTPEYKIVITWKDRRAKISYLTEYLDSLKIKYDYDYDNSRIEFTCHGEDHKRNAMTTIIERIGYYIDDEDLCECSSEEQEEERDKIHTFKTETYMLTTFADGSIVERPTDAEKI